MFDCKRSEMSEVIYDNVTLNRGERIEMMVDIYESSDFLRNHEVMINTERHQELQHTGSVSMKNRRHEAVQVCLWLLCVLLLTAVIVLCVYFTTDRKHLLTHNYNLTKEREKILTEYTEILNQNRNLTEEREQIKNKTDELLKALQVEKHQCLMNISRLSEERNRLKELDRWLTEQGWSTKTFNWIYYNFSFYYFSSEWKNWSDSREFCKQRGADLVIMNSKEEQEFLKKFTKTYYQNHHHYYYYYWIGLRQNKGEWKWVDDTKLTTRNWIYGDPNTYKGNCAVISTSGWTQYSCDWNRRWICEKRF
ncbi:asialoglycoprotein receptor 1-like [Triplophysa dalaica]|uniref:asialoglycoprotein receptor 1-like n=1 Tax=Triplophysa dalaica TaxID=1582913 RepID=UPI0024DF39BF|nr:asialoglycoprotein receptor 1-like [Triplophysa dalaica]